MTTATLARRAPRPSRPDASLHIYTVGQTVRMKSGFAQRASNSGLYRITGTLPPLGAFPQYRVRSADETHERVTTQDNLEPVLAFTNTTAAEGMFRHE